MKACKTSFLFFLLIFSTHHYGFVQQSSDSLGYYTNVAEYPQNYNDLISSYSYFKGLYTKAIDRGEVKRSIYFLYYIATIEYKRGDYNTSEKSIVSAITLLDQLTNSSFKAQTKQSLYNLMGLIYIEQKNDVKALEFYSKALEKSENSLDSAKIYNNKSLIYKSSNAYGKAKQELEKGFALLPRITDTLIMAKIIDNLGVIENELDKTKGLFLIHKALELRVVKGDTSTIYTSYSHLSDYYYKINNKIESKRYALKANELAEIINSPSYKQNALGLLIRLSEDDNAKQYKLLNDSLYNAEKQSSNNFALMKYDVSEANRKALESQLEKEAQESRTLIAFLIASFVTILSVCLYFILKSKHKKEKVQQAFETESRISKHIHDEVANDVFQFMTKLEGETITNAHLIDDLQSIYHKTRDISKVHSLLEDDEPFTDTIKDLVLSYSDTKTSVIDKGSADINWEGYSKMKRTTIYKVLQELLINMKKHSQASVAVLMFKNEGKKLVISYTDNGVGSDFKKSTGLQNVENRIESINGTLTFDTEPSKGFKTKIII
jgi:signal transduction histidine kinase